jgi:transposase
LGATYDEAAEICDCAVGTVKSRLNRARSRLLLALNERSGRTSVERELSYPVASLMRLEDQQQE